MKSALLQRISPSSIDSAIRFFLYLLLFWLPYSPAVIEICVVLSVVLWFLKRCILLRRQNLLVRRTSFSGLLEAFKPPASPLNAPIGLFLIACALSVLGSFSPGQSLHNFFTKTLEWFVIYFLVLEVFQARKHFKVALTIFIVTSLATALDSLVQYYFTHKDIFLQNVIAPGGRATAGFKAPNGLGAYWTLFIPCLPALLLIRGGTIWRHVLIWLTLICAAWSLVITFSRGAWMAVFVGCLFMVVSYARTAGKLRYRHYVGLSVILVGAGFFLWLFFHKNLQFGLLNRMGTVQWRINVWQDSMHMIYDKPFFGHGINTFMRLFEAYRRDYGSSPTYAHNSYLQLTTEVGLFGLASFVWMISAMCRAAIANKRIFLTKDFNMVLLSMGLFSGIVAFLAHSFVDTNFYSLQLSVYLWFAIGILMAVLNRLSGIVSIRKACRLDKDHL